MNISAQISFFSRVSFLDKLLFTKHLAIMIRSGITIVEAVTILSQQAKSDKFEKILTTIAADLQNGNALANALRKHPNVFDAFYVSMIEIGETSGALEENLSYLSDQLAKAYAFHKKVKGVLMYPILVLTAAGVIGMSIGLFVLPKLIDLFSDFDAKLPLSTRILLNVSVLMRDHGTIIVIAFVAFVIIFRYFVSLPFVKPAWQRFLFFFPVVGNILRNIELASFTRSLGVMLKSGLPITSALEIETRMTTNVVFKGYMKRMLEELIKGKSLSIELSTNNYPLIPLIATKMIAVGEKTGKLNETLLYLGQFFEDEVDDATKNLSTLLEPVLLLVIGVVVAFVAFAVISPIYELTGSIKR
ncbi:MAG: type II secretion system F family protein [Candidatus Levybacteria bacterium]|nr:type II secretion system F family protein [Candidatus Levybacteria bacterium]